MHVNGAIVNAEQLLQLNTLLFQSALRLCFCLSFSISHFHSRASCWLIGFFFLSRQTEDCGPAKASRTRTNTCCIPNPLVFGPDNMLIAAAVHSCLLIAVIIAREMMLDHGREESETSPTHMAPTHQPRLNQSQPPFLCFCNNIGVLILKLMF